jgi:hypothetical protein
MVEEEKPAATSTPRAKAKPRREIVPPVVAELGRPETPDETAARKAENSRKHRANQTLINLLYSLAATLAVVVVLVLVVVRPEAPPRDPINYSLIAEQSQAQATQPLIVPALPPQWVANNATLRTGSDGVVSWYIGFITPNEQFIAVTQGIEANPTWVATLLNASVSTGSEEIEGISWQVFDNRNASAGGDQAPGNLVYAMVATVGANTYVLNGTADANEFRTVATTISTTVSSGVSGSPSPGVTN